MKEYVTAKQIELQLVNLKQLVFEVTDACNLNCTYCGYGELYNDYDKREGKNMPVEKAVAMIDYLSKLWKSNKNQSYNKVVFISFYGGEPLLNMKFIKLIINYIKTIDVPRSFIYTMTTNAVLLDKYIDFLVENQFNILISLDGNKKNNSYRVDKKGNYCYWKVMKNINYVKNKFPEYFKNKVNFNSVIHDRNSYEEIFYFIKDKFDKKPQIGELNNIGVNENKKYIFEQMYCNSYKSLMESNKRNEIIDNMFIQSDIYRNLTSFIHLKSSSYFNDYNELIYGKYNKKDMPSGTCIPFSKKMFVTVNGKILPCERIGHQFGMGQINDDITITLDYKEIARKHNYYLNKISKQCINCKISNMCMQCIYNIENIDKETKIYCSNCLSNDEFEIIEQYYMSFLSKHPHDYYRILREIVIN